MSNLVRLDPIGPLAIPPKADLLAARRAIYMSRTLQQLFNDAAAEGWDEERLCGALEEGFFRVLGERVGTETVRYLAEEFAARDKTQTLLVSAETGLAVAQVSPDALYQPAPVAREGTDNLATPPMRLKPEVESAIVQHHHAQAQEAELTAKLQERARSTELQRLEGDTRLRVATRVGRRRLAAQLLEELPALFHDHRGASGRLLRRCRLNEPVPETHSLALELTLFGHVSVLVADGLTHNFRYDVFGSVRDRIRSGWVRTLARAIAEQAHLGRPAVEVNAQAELGAGLLVASPDVVKAVSHVEKLSVVENVAAVLAGVVYLTLLDEPKLDAYESEAWWNVDASIGVCAHLDPVSLHPLVFTDVFEAEASVEIIR